MTSISVTQEIVGWLTWAASTEVCAVYKLCRMFVLARITVGQSPENLPFFLGTRFWKIKFPTFSVNFCSHDKLICFWQGGIFRVNLYQWQCTILEFMSKLYAQFHINSTVISTSYIFSSFCLILLLPSFLYSLSFTLLYFTFPSILFLFLLFYFPFYPSSSLPSFFSFLRIMHGNPNRNLPTFYKSS